MKVRLLKKLRNEVGRKYAIMKCYDGYHVYNTETNFLFGLSGPKIEHAKEDCLREMNECIRIKLINLRKRYPSRKLIEYYPW